MRMPTALPRLEAPLAPGAGRGAGMMAGSMRALMEPQVTMKPATRRRFQSVATAKPPDHRSVQGRTAASRPDRAYRADRAATETGNKRLLTDGEEVGSVQVPGCVRYPYVAAH